MTFNNMAAVASAAAAAGIATAYLVWAAAYPKPIPGIPYNKDSAASILGDLPRLLAQIKRDGDVKRFFIAEAYKFDGPIFQLFLFPFRRPVVVISDFGEIRDIMMHRVKEFDRSTRSRDIFQPIGPCSQVTLATDDIWRFHRRLVQDTMSPVFLRNVAAPNLYSAFQNLIVLWNQRCDLADGRPFSVALDFSAATFDGVLAFTFGHDFAHSATKPHIEALAGLEADDLTRGLGIDDAVEFPVGPLHSDLDCMQRVATQTEKWSSFPMVKLAWLLFGNTAEFRKLFKMKDAVIQEEIRKAVVSQAQHEDDDTRLKNAIDLIVSRETRLAEKDGRQPDYYSRTLVDELYGFLIAGHETTSSTMAWTIKILTEFPAVQAKLRSVLHQTHSAAAAEKRNPTVDELMSHTPAYLEAFMAETLRWKTPSPINSRTATQDARILGHHIPKHTTVNFVADGPSFLSRSRTVDDALRTDTYRKDQATYPMAAETDDMDQFIPERWLRETAGGELVFDVNLWPNTSFGLGPRGCFGKKLAYIEYQFLIVLIVWNFELLGVPEALSGWEGFVQIAYRPRQCYIRARKLGMDGTV